jgi:hypothetical protein
VKLPRRDLLKLGASSALGWALGGCASADSPAMQLEAAQGRLWGTPGSHQLEGMMSSERIPDGMLEVFALGGISPWETFYVVPEHGDPAKGGPYAGQQWWTFQDDDLLSIPKMFARCDGGDRKLIQPFGQDEAGMQVNLGPFVWPLRDRPDILSRMRIWVMAHEAEPHHAAIPLALTGHGRGALRMAGFGTHLERFHQDRRPPGWAAPFSYAVYQTSLDIDGNADAASSVGIHRASARPMSVRLGPENPLPKQLLRRSVEGYSGSLDGLVNYYTQRFAARRQLRGAGAVTRTPVLSDYMAARRVMENHSVLSDMLTAEALSSSQASMCQEGSILDQTRTSLQLAAHLLTDPGAPARYVNVLEGGLYPDPSGLGYDTHGSHVRLGGSNVVHMCQQLAAIINQPKENDPRKLDLDRHMVLINTEFGRTPSREFSKANPKGQGLDHWPWGYVVVGFGGPLDEERSGVVGAIGENARAIGGVSPTEHRAAMLLAMGIWPFSQESFAVADVRGVGTELEAALHLKERVLGYG